MLPGISAKSEKEQNQTIQNYYKFQSKIYDLTRWSFLFGRIGIVKQIPFPRDAKINILEVGCGTGYSMRLLAKRFPNATITGMDVSEDMIDIATKQTARFGDRINLICGPYMKGSKDFNEQMDVILFSYSLTMINPQWSELLEQAKVDLKKGGVVALADFHNSNFGFFKRHMSNHHVRMDGHLLKAFKDDSDYTSVYEKVKAAYLGIWHYVMYIGRKK